MMDLNAVLEGQKEEINRELDRVVPPEQTPPVDLHRAMRHSLFAGGKRLRPIMVLEACALAGAERSLALNAALGIECLHTFTLIHDDLPCMDDDDFRRGVPTCHKVFGEDLAVLAGDALVFLGLDLLARPAEGVCPETTLEVVRVGTRTLGSRGVIGGQVIDLQAEGQIPSLEVLESIHIHKTAFLVMGSLEIGGLIGGADKLHRERLREYGRHFGLAFQITDDVLDVTGESRVLGKTAGKDQQQQKMTYPALMGVDRSRQEARAHVEQAVASLEGYGQKESWFFRMLAHSLLDRVS